MNISNLLPGSKTKTGKQTYLFYNKEHKIVEVLPETAEKNKYKPVLKNHNDDKLKEIEVKKQELNNKLNSEISKKENISSLEELQKRELKRELERLKKRKEEKISKQTEKLKQQTENIEDLKTKYSPSQQIKMQELLDKKQKAEEKQKIKSDKIKKELEIENKKQEEVERLQKHKEVIQSKISKQETTKEEPKVGVKKLKREEINEVIKKETLQDRLDQKSKENFILNQIFNNPIAKILADYIEKNSKFEIFHNGILIYSSNNTSKDKIILKESHFELFDKKYPYSGLRFKKL